MVLYRKHHVRFVWVKGHDGNPENERCDRLAVAAANSGDLKEDAGYTGKEEIANGALRSHRSVHLPGTTCRQEARMGYGSAPDKAEHGSGAMLPCAAPGHRLSATKQTRFSMPYHPGSLRMPQGSETASSNLNR